MTLDIATVWDTMLPVGRGFSALFAVMAASLVVLTVERLVVLARADESSRTFAGLAGKLADERRFAELVQLASKHQDSPLARLFGAIAFRYGDASGEAEGGRTPAIELARNESSRCLARLAEEARQRGSVLATLSWLAPWVGALGTVIALIEVLSSLGAAPAPSLAALLAGISGALVQFALGAALAIPAKVACAYFAERARLSDAALSGSASEFLDELEQQPLAEEPGALRHAA